ncbi:MAG: translation elongation factor Ts [Deltaproteobacteria bacterium]|nr:translation elongation factor Ts [Deltaproteobacteria bacterium]NIS78599.1 translation elongation factor Ts [Deltaproteobacteria bacterium]
MSITPHMIKELREKTGAGIMDCKEALVEAEGDAEKALDHLRKKGLAHAAKKASRVASEGLVESYIHGGGKIGVLVEVNCETDFVAKTEEFRELARNICMQVAASNPQCVSIEDVPEAVIQKEREIYREQALDSGKPQKVIEKIVEGKLGKFYEEACLLEQDYIRDPEKKVRDVVADAVAKFGENIVVRRFERFVLGDGTKQA